MHTLCNAVQNQKNEEHIKTLNCEYTYLFNDTLKIRLDAIKYIWVYIHVCIHTHKVLEKLGKV